MPTASSLQESLHEQDFYAWTQQQADLLKSGRLTDLDKPYLGDNFFPA